ncbi:ankyrin repeat domain-containing protein 50 [Acipenser oxyrinchus oxyrinchus]|uniref:Ankyrin repeat domain-containing protein 50 n=1 Tax=Acipenser oxyrinchus oxyrinchus TaxID=40147 RepID=A0AAD8DHY1_ACIOX|nr:ankyrin repeat domain-containing protein 50 [Acipenser oxyrinchus oxyrinchus]
MSVSRLQGRRFYCRDWALYKLQHWLETRASGRIFGALVTGGPGSGKTAFCTEVLWPTSEAGTSVNLAPRCLAHHFCQREDERTVSVTEFILGLVEQLRCSPLLPGYFEKLEEPSVKAALEPNQCERDPDEAFKRAVLLPLLDLPLPSQNLLLIVESLDSGPVTGAGQEGHAAGKSRTIAELLSSHQQLLPSWLLLVCSVRRQNKALIKMFLGFRKLCLDDLRKAHTVRDVQQYILWRLDQERALRRHLTRETADMLNQLHIKSNGCFLFLERVLDGVAENFVAIREIRDIPGTLNGLYLWLCQRLFPRKLFSRVQPLLNALLASPRPLNLEELYTAVWTRDTTLTPIDFHRNLDSLSKLLVDGPSSTKLLFHASFAEWLIDVKYCTQKYLCSLAEGHAMLAMSLTLRGPQLSPNEIHWLAFHLVSSNLQPENPTLLALWMVWGGIPSLADNSLTPEPFPLTSAQQVLQLLVKAGAYPASSYGRVHNWSSSVGCAVSVGMIRKALEREDSVRVLLENGTSVNQMDPGDGRTLLASAAHAGSTDVFALLLSKGADPQIQDHQGQTPVMLAARQGHARVLQCLLAWAQWEERAPHLVNHADREGWTALRSAAWGGHAEAVRILLEAGAEVDGSDSEGRTALRAAAWGGHEEILCTLLDYGAQVDQPDREGRTPLIAAAYMGHKEAVELLLDHGAQVDVQDSDGRTALSVAALCVPSAAGLGYCEVVSLLLERGADPGHKDRDGMTPLLLAAYEGHAEVVELLLEAGADVDEAAGPQGGSRISTAVTPLLAAASMGHVFVVNTLLFWGAAVDAIDGEGRTALSLAATRGNVDVVRTLLDRGLDENHRDDLGWTPLHSAACEGHLAVCAALTKQGSAARVTEMDNDGRTPLILAAQEGHCDCVRLLLERHSPLDHRGYDGRSALSASALEGHVDVVELLLRRGSELDVRDAEGRPLLYLLVLEGLHNMVGLLLEKGGVPLESSDTEGRTALHVASWQGQLESVSLLLCHSADANALDGKGRSPLHSAAWQGHAAIARLLIESGGANVDQACCQQGATALCIAAQEGHTAVVSVLLEKGANPNHVDLYRRTPVKVAGKRGHGKIVRLLESYGAPPYCGFLPPSPLPQQQKISTTKTHSSGITSASSGSPREASMECRLPPCHQHPHYMSSSPSGSPESTTERCNSLVASEKSLQSSKTSSSTYHSLATAQTVPVDSLSFTHQIQQHSLPRSRSRHSNLVSPTSSLYINDSKPKTIPIQPEPSNAPTTPCRHWTPLSSPTLGKGNMDSPKAKTPTPTNMTVGVLSSVPEKTDSPQHTGGGKWNSFMASLGVTPGHDSPIRPLRSWDSPPLGYPVVVGPTVESQQRNGEAPRKPFVSTPSKTTIEFPPSALLPEPLIAITTLDPQLNLKQAIKLQFEGPTSALSYERETPM